MKEPSVKGTDEELAASRGYDHLQTACRTFEQLHDHAIAAIVSHAMAMVQTKYGVGDDHIALD